MASLSLKERVLDRTLQSVCDAENVVIGYIGWHLMSSFNDAAGIPGDLIESRRKKEEPACFEFIEEDSYDIEDKEQEDRVDDFQVAGICAGIAQDIATAGFAVSYAAGNDSGLAKAAACIIGGKIVLNGLSYGAARVYEKITGRNIE